MCLLKASRERKVLLSFVVSELLLLMKALLATAHMSVPNIAGPVYNI